MARTLDPAEQAQLVAALADGQWHRGEALAERFGIGRAALSKRMERLSDWGLEVQSQTGVGYRLPDALQLLDANEIREHAGDRLLDVPVTVASWLDSTNARLLEASSASDPQILLAEGQSAGRGRRGRQWVSPYAHNLYASMSWRFSGWLPQLPALPLAVAVVLWRRLRALGLEGAGIKWPNDLLVCEHKLAGILIENQGEASGAFRVVIGFGLNIRMPAGAAQRIDQQWTALSRCLPAMPNRNQLAADLLADLLFALRDFERGGFEPFAADYRRADVLQGKAIRVIDEQREQLGTARGIDASGALRMETEDGQVRALYSGDVSVRRVSEAEH